MRNWNWLVANASKSMTVAVVMLALAGCETAKRAETPTPTPTSPPSVDAAAPSSPTPAEAEAAEQVAEIAPEPVVEAAESVAAAPAPARSAAPRGAPAPTASSDAIGSRSASAPRAATAGRTRGLQIAFDTPRDVRILPLVRGGREPNNAVFHGYMLIGPQVAADRKAAVMRALACEVDSVASAEEAEAIGEVGVMTVPSREAPPTDRVLSPTDLLNLYDFPRARNWLAAANNMIGGEAFDPSAAVVFIGSTQQRGAQLDDDALTVSQSNASDPIIADASNLSRRYLERWTYEIVQNVRGGTLRDRASMQQLMEIHSWIEMIGGPFAQVMQLAEPAQAEALAAPTCL